MVAIVVAGLTVSYSPSIQSYLDFNPTSIRYKMEFKKLHEAGMVKFPSLTAAKVETKNSSIFIEDPLLKTEDVIKADNEEELVNEASVKPATVAKPAPKKATEAPKATLSTGFSGFEETKTTPKEEPAKTDAFSSGFEDTKTDAFSGGFEDTKVEPKTEENKPATAIDDSDTADSDEDSDDADDSADTDETEKPASTDEGGFDDF